MKKRLILIVAAVVIIAVFCVVRDLVIKNVVAAMAGDVIGAPVQIDGFSLSLIRQSVKISGLRIYNPPGFPPDILVDIPLTSVSCDVIALARGKIHLREVTLDLKEICLVKNKERKLNVDELKIVEKVKAMKPVKQMPMQLDVVQLHIGRVVNKDYSVNGAPAVAVHEVNIRKAYKNITSAQQLAALIIAEPLKTAGIRGLAVYGATILTGVAMFPVAATLAVTGKDYAQASYTVSWEVAYAAGLGVLKASGTVQKEDKASGVIIAQVRGTSMTLKLAREKTKLQITVSARKYFLPRPDEAAGIIYLISDKLK
jgi:hypothetical protein